MIYSIVLVNNSFSLACSEAVLILLRQYANSENQPALVVPCELDILFFSLPSKHSSYTQASSANLLQLEREFQLSGSIPYFCSSSQIIYLN